MAKLLTKTHISVDCKENVNEVNSRYLMRKIMYWRPNQWQ